jgi:structural maintenance of chromosome 2
MKPIEILGMIEEAAGTRMFESKKQNAVKTIEKKETKLLEIDRVMSDEVEPRIEKLSAQRSQYLEYTTLSAEVESTGRVVQAYEFVCAKDAKLKCAANQEGDAKERAHIVQRLADGEKEEAELKKKLSDTLARKEKESAGELKKLEVAEQEASKDLVKLSAEHAQLRKGHDSDAAAATGIESEIQKTEVAQRKADDDLVKAKAVATKASEQATAATAAAQEKQQSYEAAMGLGAASAGEGVKNLQAQLSDAGTELSTRETELKTAEMRKKHLAKEIKETEKKVADARKSGGKQEKVSAPFVPAMQRSQGPVVLAGLIFVLLIRGRLFAVLTLIALLPSSPALSITGTRHSVG